VAEPLAALRTHEGLLPGVDAPVLPQVAQIVEVAAAVGALVPALDFNLLLHRGAYLPEAGPDSVVLVLIPAAAPPGPVVRGGRGRLQDLEDLGAGGVRVYQLDVLLQEQGVGAEGSAQRADVGVAGELLA